MKKFYSYEIESPICNRCTCFKDDLGRELHVIQQRYNPEYKYTWWGPIDRELADKIFEELEFSDYFDDHAWELVEVRKVIWALRLPKIPKQPWETRF